MGGAGRAPAPSRTAPATPGDSALGHGRGRAACRAVSRSISLSACLAVGAPQSSAARALGPGRPAASPKRGAGGLRPMGRRPSGGPRPAPPAAPGSLAPAGRDRRTDRPTRAARLSSPPRRQARGCAARPDPCSAGGRRRRAERAGCARTPAGTWLASPPHWALRGLLRATLQLYRAFPHLLLPQSPVVQVAGARPRGSTAAGHFLCCWAPSLRRPHALVPRARRRWSPKAPPVA